MASLAPAERAAVRTMIWASVAAAAAVPMLVLPAPDRPLLPVTAHLAVLVSFSLALTFHLAPLHDEPWFEASGLSVVGRRALAGVWLVVLVTGATGLVTLATSAAYRFDPSLQFLQALSALDIAWAAAALVLGVRRWLGTRAAVGAGGMLGVVCVWSIWNYLNTVGFATSGGWLVDGGEIARLVLPFDAAAAVMAIVAFTIGVRST